jgi:hypothetical protein
MFSLYSVAFARFIEDTVIAIVANVCHWIEE